MPVLYKEFKTLGISNNRIFATLICIKYLLTNDRYWHDFVDLIDMLFEKYTDVNIELMGFPKEWYKLLLR